MIRRNKQHRKILSFFDWQMLVKEGKISMDNHVVTPKK